MYKIVFIDDEPITVRMLERAIDWEQYSVNVCGTASDGEEGIALFRQVEPDIVIVDIRMPRMNGIEFAEAIRQTKKRVKILILSAHAEFEYAQSAITYQISDYLLKPLDEDKLETSIARIIAELDRDNAVHSTIETYRLEQAEKQLRHLFLSYLEGNDANTGFTVLDEVQAVFGQADALIHFLRLLDPDEEQMRTDTEGLRLFLKDRFGPQTAVIAQSPVDIIALTGGPNLKVQLQDLQNVLSLREQPTVVGIACLVPTIDLIEAYRRAEFALSECFYSGEALCFYTANHYFSEAVPIALSEFEQPIAAIIEQGNCDELVGCLHIHLSGMFRQRVDPALIHTIVYDVLNWIKIAIAKEYTAERVIEICSVDRNRLRACGSSENLIAYLDSRLQQISAAVRELMAEEPGYFVVKQAKDYARAHYASVEFSLQDVADCVGLSKNHFSRVFHQTTGVKFWDYVTQLRIDRAKELLKQSNRSNYEICSAIGYESEFYFSKIFKRVVGVTAQEFRRL